MSYRPYVSSRSGRFQWVMQRVSAVLLLFLVFAHFILQHFTASAVTTGLTVSARFNDPMWQGFYVIFVVLGLYHGINGLIGIVNAYMPKPILRGITWIVLWTLAAVFTVLGISNIVSPRPLGEVKLHYAEHGFSAGETRGSPPLAPAYTYSFRDQGAELPMLRWYLMHHVHSEEPVAIDVIFGTQHPIPEANVAEIGSAFDRWAREQISYGPASIDERDRDAIFSSTYEFAIWALNVRRANAQARGDEAVADRLSDAPPYAPTLF